MAYNKKTTTKTINKTEPKTTVSEVEKEVREYSAEDDIECVSVTAGELIMIGKKTGNLYKWENYGDTTTVEYQDLKAEMRNAKSAYIYSPLFMIEDEELLATPEFAKVAESYKDAISIDDIDNFFDLTNQQFNAQLKKLPKGIQNTIKSIAVDKINDGTLDSIQKIKILDSVLGTDLYNLLGNG